MSIQPTRRFDGIVTALEKVFEGRKRITAATGTEQCDRSTASTSQPAQRVQPTCTASCEHPFWSAQCLERGSCPAPEARAEPSTYFT
ncbi:hypothetical protein [Pseudomonas sp. RP23018S]|uniref:hypothetical protein n=1 Tax=Pseudomonas sp. RP23018S TaxID=3096037 RepID=UPI002ACC20FD|nr:hypothetical protein [Pseudomonas sp. RP23018S]